ncbi:MAG: hypothetical protein PHW00_06410 [Clostridia bacterium]|nr:hypothetical protein [Clostridia bacterium]MDD3832264.1 hypothetical protein [Clostridia bacterium]
MILRNEHVAILDFGSSKITCFVGVKTDDGFVIKATGTSKYDGYLNGEWLEPSKLKDAVSVAIQQANHTLGSKINSVFVGVPGEFTTVISGEASINFHFKKKVTRDDLADIFNKANIYADTKGLTAINRSSIYYVINNEQKVIDPVGLVAKKVMGLVSFIFVTDTFKKPVGKILSQLGITVTEYVSGCLAEALFLLPKQTRDKFALLIDVGYISSSVMLVGGDGLVFMKSFSLGSGHVCADLSQVLDVAFPVAEQLLSRVNLNLEVGPKDIYTLKDGVEVNALQTNQIVMARIEDIAQFIVKCFAECDFAIPSNTPVYITGGGMTYIRGGVDYLAKSLHKQITIPKPTNASCDKHEHMSAYGLMDLAVAHAVPKKKFFRFF